MKVTVETRYEYRSRCTTALSEVQILNRMGEEGWELIDLGPSRLYFRRPRNPAAVTPWEYTRRTGLLDDSVRQQITAQGWVPTGDWVLFHYFRRHRTNPSVLAPTLPSLHHPYYGPKNG